jgi:hypothetical protein
MILKNLLPIPIVADRFTRSIIVKGRATAEDHEPTDEIKQKAKGQDRYGSEKQKKRLFREYAPHENSLAPSMTHISF